MLSMQKNLGLGMGIGFLRTELILNDFEKLGGAVQKKMNAACRF